MAGLRRIANVSRRPEPQTIEPHKGAWSGPLLAIGSRSPLYILRDEAGWESSGRRERWQTGWSKRLFRRHPRDQIKEPAKAIQALTAAKATRPAMNMTTSREANACKTGRKYAAFSHSAPANVGSRQNFGRLGREAGGFIERSSNKPNSHRHRCDQRERIQPIADRACDGPTGFPRGRFWSK